MAAAAPKKMAMVTAMTHSGFMLLSAFAFAMCFLFISVSNFGFGDKTTVRGFWCTCGTRKQAIRRI